ncbi:GNAT family N-acetyltransferase, partial [Pseudomonas sp. MPR-R2A5]
REKRPGVSEIGYLVARQHWGSGIAREAVSAVLDQVLRVEGQRRVIADTDPENTASNGLLKALGFTLEGRLREEWETHLGVRDTFLWGLLASDW